MKLITAAFLALTISTGALAASADDICIPLGKMAASFQNNRQVGVPLDVAMKALNGVDLSGVPGLKDVARQILLDQYQQLRYPDEVTQQGAVSAAQADVMDKCYRAMSK